MPERKRPGDITPCAAGSVLAPLAPVQLQPSPDSGCTGTRRKQSPTSSSPSGSLLPRPRANQAPCPSRLRSPQGLALSRLCFLGAWEQWPGALEADCLCGSPGLSAEETADPKPWWSHFCWQRASAVLGSAHLVRGHCWSPTPATRCGNPKGTGEGPVAPAFALWRPRFRPLLAGPFLSHILVMSHKHQAEQCRVCLG